MPELDTIEILKEILTGLCIVHEQNVVHQDLKPDNVIRRASDGKLVLVDFGVVKQVRVATTAVKADPITMRMTAIGTDGYMPIEQAIGMLKPTSDVYACGAIGIQLVTGTQPHLLFNEKDMILKWEHLRTVDRGLAKILNKMVSPVHSQRYRNGGPEALRR